MTRTSRHGLTRTEVVVVVAIGVFLVALFMPTATRRVRGPAEYAQCANNLRQVTLGLHSYLDMNGRGGAVSASGAPEWRATRFPTGCLGPGETPEQRLSWLVELLPYLENETLYKQFRMEGGYGENLGPAKSEIAVFRCPGSDEPQWVESGTHYVAISGIGLDAAHRPAGAPDNGFMGYDRVTTPAMITDGMSNTIALMETRRDLGPWARGGNSNVRCFDPSNQATKLAELPFGGHRANWKVAFADGSVRTISASVEPHVLAAALTIAGGETSALELD